MLPEDAVSLAAENYPQQNCSDGRMFDVDTKHRFVAHPGHKSYNDLLGIGFTAPPNAGANAIPIVKLKEI